MQTVVVVVAMRVAGVDIGIRNLAVCVLDVSPVVHAGSGVLRAARSAVLAADRLEWIFGELCDAKQNANHCSHTGILDRLVLFVREHASVLCEWAECVVIEAQPAARMKMLAGALYALLREQSPHLRLVMQAARKKLVWCPAELDAWVPAARRQATYADRKKAAVALCAFLVSEEDGRSNVAAEADASFRACRKKDDAADSLLHALHFSVYGERGGPPATKRRRIAAPTT